MTYLETIREVAQKNQLDEKLVKDIYLSYFKFIKTHMKELPLKKGLTEEELGNMLTDFNVKGLGKFVVKHKMYRRLVWLYNHKGYINKKTRDKIKAREEHETDEDKEDKTPIHIYRHYGG